MKIRQFTFLSGSAYMYLKYESKLKLPPSMWNTSVQRKSDGLYFLDGLNHMQLRCWYRYMVILILIIDANVTTTLVQNSKFELFN